MSSQHEHAHREGAHDHEDAGHSHGQEDEHSHAQGPLGWLKELLPFGHGHSHGEVSVDDALESSKRGIWALKVSLVGLGITALFQLFVVFISGSVALLADTIHNASDALTAVPLWIAFALAKRPPTRRYTYGYGRAEDVAGVVVVVMILVSALVAAYESILKLANPEAPSNLLWVGVAAVSGFIGNEAVAQFRMRVGKEIGSAALVADGQHARVDGFTSLAVLLGVIGVWLGYPLADPLIGLLITLAILFILKDAALTMWHRLMDAVDPEFVETVEHTAAGVEGVHEVHSVRVRWLGHRLQAEMHIMVDEDLPTSESHRIAEEVRHRLLHNLPKLESAGIHVDPCGHSGTDPHHLTAHHATRKARTGTGNATS
ncbi:MAG TPA: cation diffusion facilitator family transporter [Chloroflexia bacterium]|nr:cation diffusion facilitator family transporter [Chloroflexia bacterium]